MSFLQNLLRAAPGMARGGIVAGATPNIAGGGATDVLRSMQAAGDDAMQRDMLMYGLRERAQDRQMREHDMRRQEDNDRYKRERDKQEDEYRRLQTKVQLSQIAEPLTPQQEQMMATGQGEMETPQAPGMPPLKTPFANPIRQQDVINFDGVPFYMKSPTARKAEDTADQLATYRRQREIATEETLNQKAGEAQIAQSMMRPVPPVIARALGLPADYKVPVNELDTYVRMVEARSQREASEALRRELANEANQTRRDIAEMSVSARRDIASMAGGGGGSFIPTTDAQGNLTGAWNPKTGAYAQPPEAGLRRSGVSAGEQAKRADIQTMLEDATMLEGLAEKHRGNIGIISGRAADLKRNTVGVDGDLNDLFRISDNLADKLLRARSGAQINEQEFKRLRALVPDPRKPYAKFTSDLAGFKDELTRTLAARTGGVAPPPQGPPNAGATVLMVGPDGVKGTVPAANVAAFERNGYKRVPSK